MEDVHVLIETSEGDILVELLPQKAPESVTNFLRYVEEGHFDQTLFHRVVRGFIIQGGGFDRDLNKKPVHPPVVNEAKNGLSNIKGSLALARAEEKDSARDEFFINAEDNPELDHQDETDEGYGYTVFGRVVEGLDVVKKINWKVVKARPDFPDLPRDEVVIRSIQPFA